MADYGRVDTSTEPRSHTRRRAATALTVAVVVLAAGLHAAVALAASRPTLSLRSKPKTVVYTQTTRLSGHLSSGKLGVVVKLQRRVWPFGGSYETVAKTRTGAHGAYSFEQHPSLATEYRTVATASGGTSGVRTIYVVKAFRLLGCDFTRPGYAHRACGTQRVTAGTYTLRITA
ncbi:MAG: hypothetical protein JO240_17405, partial [Solirubrobacterales bacterium]|nr:hypothetical protein [Solirubrobacterales bacterium]